mgnify:CR=1 FL=1
MFKIIIIVAILFVLLMIFALCKLNSDISREEEKETYQNKSEVE